MRAAEVRAELENDQFWRRKEIRDLQNVLFADQSEDRLAIARRVVVVLMYAHFEGFCRFALLAYVNEVNASGLSCKDVQDAVAAASLADLFHSLRDPQRKCDLFRRHLPDDSDLHRFARDREFVSAAYEALERKVALPERLFEPGSNMTPVLLQRCLYRIGLPHDLFRHLDSDINMLLGYRNKIAHGETSFGVPAKAFLDIERAVYHVMDNLSGVVMNAVAEEQYRRRQAS